MNEKETKKLDEKGEEKISGGTKVSDKAKEILIKTGIDPEKLKDDIKKLPKHFVAMEYGAPFIRIPRLPIRTLKPVEPKEKPEQPVEPLVPANPVKPLEQEK